MAYVLQDGKGKKIACYSSCLDITYAQAELLLMADQAKKDHPDCFIAGFCDTKMQLGVERFLEPHRATPDTMKKIEEYRAQIKEKGFRAFSLREYLGEMENIGKDGRILVGKAIDPIVTQMAQLKEDGQDVDVDSMVEDIYANPLHAGVCLEFKANVMDETWIGDAARSIKRTGTERWLRRMLNILRFYLKGRPLTPLPNKNDRCPCGSSRKYGKCCGQGIEHEDPEDCKLGKHQFTAWEKVDAKLIRSCRECFRVSEPPWFERTQVKGVNVLVIGCRACSARPRTEDIVAEIEDAMKWHTCPACMKPLAIESLTIEHLWEDGKHMEQWTATEVVGKEESADLQSVGLESVGLARGVFLHKPCFLKALPGWPQVSKPSNAPKPLEFYVGP